ncbi:hypothetical protein [Yinghuangia sp. YIM S09857]|uniref:hypothetical protein n=1 Tax=Yinghuangia sp. YIM S09857 TaxID=3436929 RepID=UPI003F530822
MSDADTGGALDFVSAVVEAGADVAGDAAVAASGVATQVVHEGWKVSKSALALAQKPPVLAAGVGAGTAVVFGASVAPALAVGAVAAVLGAGVALAKEKGKA